MSYYRRELEHSVLRAIQQFPAVLITGPRQAGKSTLLQHCLPNHRYLSFDDPKLRALVHEDPELFLATHRPPIILDEIQYVPELFPYLKMQIDKRRHDYGQYVLTGSQLFQLMHGVTETLAGRMAIFSLYPFSWKEIPDAHPKDDLKMADQLVQGFYPEFFRVPGLDWEDYYRSYVTTYLERDLRNLKAISDLSRFQTFLRLLATRAGQLLNLSEVAKECGISQPTAKDWISVLQATYIVYLLKPYHRNHTKRLVKSPKLYFYDTGLLCYLLDLTSGEHFWKVRERGSLFENMIVMECLKQLSKDSIYFYRTAKGVEVDLLIQRPDKLLAYEIKLSKSPSKQDATSLDIFCKDHKETESRVLCLREDPLPLTRTTTAIHWSELLNLGY